MTRRNRANVVIGAILAWMVVLAGGLGYFAETGQWTPSFGTHATMSDQRDSAVSNDVANHTK